MNIKKAFGWILVFCGLLIILWTLYMSFNIFTAKRPVPAVFKPEKIVSKESEVLPQGENQIKPKIGKTPQTVEELQKIIQSQLNQLALPQSYTKIFNLISWSIFAGIFIFGGGKIASIGTELIRKT